MITLSDNVTPTGTIDVTLSGGAARISGSHVGIDVISGTPVIVRAVSFFIRIRIRWNGGVTPATILEIDPGSIITNASVSIQTGAPTYEWVLEYDNVNSIPRDRITIGATPGNLLQTVTYTGFALGISRTAIGFITKASSGTPIAPNNGDECWLEIGPGAT